MTDNGQAAPLPRRKRDRYTDDHAVRNEILDEAFVCHLGMVVEKRPHVIPTYHVRVGDTCYLHASSGSGTGLAPRNGPIPVSVAVTLLDGLVYSRAAFDHSMNYRSVVIHGDATVVEDQHEWNAVADALVDKVASGRSAEVSMPTPAERAATTILALPLTQWTVKQRTGGVGDEPTMHQQKTWAGVVPVKLVAGPPEPDDAVTLPPPQIPSQLGDHDGVMPNATS